MLTQSRAVDRTQPLINPIADQRAYRLSAIDAVRGLAIVIMAIDHVRDYVMLAAEQDPLANPNIGVALFATRWITHFCAPVFVMLSGVSAGLMMGRRDARDLTRFLFTRGLWLLFIEATVISTSWTFAPRGIPELSGQVVVILQVIWAIGVSMIALSGLVRFGRWTCVAVGAALVAGHNLLDAFWPMSGLFDPQPLWVALHSQMTTQAGPFLLVVTYPVLPWIGVMALGCGVAGVFELPAARRNAILIRVGLAMSAAFVVLRALDLYGDPNPWQPQSSGMIATTIDFLNTTKYPPSLLFLLMTLGPAAIVCAIADRLSGIVKDVLIVFGRVPFAFYVAHIILIHALSVGLGVLQGFDARQLMTLFLFYPKGYGVELPWVYAMWLLVIALLYPPCRWMAALKARRRDWWLSYV